MILNTKWIGYTTHTFFVGFPVGFVVGCKWSKESCKWGCEKWVYEVSKTDWLLERTFSVGDLDGLAVGYERRCEGRKVWWETSSNKYQLKKKWSRHTLSVGAGVGLVVGYERRCEGRKIWLGTSLNKHRLKKNEWSRHTLSVGAGVDGLAVGLFVGCRMIKAKDVEMRCASY